MREAPTMKLDIVIDLLGKNSRAPEYMVDAVVYVNDTLDTAFRIASETLGSTDPTVALSIYDRLNERLRQVKIDAEEDRVHRSAKAPSSARKEFLKQLSAHKTAPDADF